MNESKNLLLYLTGCVLLGIAGLYFVYKTDNMVPQLQQPVVSHDILLNYKGDTWFTLDGVNPIKTCTTIRTRAIIENVVTTSNGWTIITLGGMHD